MNWWFRFIKHVKMTLHHLRDPNQNPYSRVQSQKGRAYTNCGCCQDCLLHSCCHLWCYTRASPHQSAISSSLGRHPTLSSSSSWYIAASPPQSTWYPKPALPKIGNLWVLQQDLRDVNACRWSPFSWFKNMKKDQKLWCLSECLWNHLYQTTTIPQIHKPCHSIKVPLPNYKSLKRKT